MGEALAARIRQPGTPRVMPVVKGEILMDGEGVTAGETAQRPLRRRKGVREIMDFRGIVGLEGKEPVGAVLTIGTKSADKGFPTDRDRFYIKVPDSSNDVRVNHPSFGAFNAAAPELRRSVRGVLVHASESECFEWHRKAQKLPPPFQNHSKLPACTGDGKQAKRLALLMPEKTVKHLDMPCTNELCQYAQAPNDRTPPACKPWARLLFQPVWQTDKLPTPLMKFVTQSWHSISAIVGFFDYIREQAALCGIENPNLFGLSFEITLTEKSSPERKTKFPVIRITPTVQVQAFLIQQAQRIGQLAERRQYVALLDAPERDPVVLAADHETVSVGLPREAP